MDWSLNTDIETKVVHISQQIALQMGLNCEPVGAPYGTDASKIQYYQGVPSIVFGPGSINQAHSRSEWVPIEQVGQAAEFYLQLARAFNNGGK